IQVPHVGWTAGGMAGATSSYLPHEMAAARVQEMIEATLRENPECICLAHGGPFAAPEDTRYLYEHTDARGFVGAPSIERPAIDLGRLDQAEAAVAARAQLEVLAVRDRAGDVQVREVEHGVERHVDLALQAEGLGQGGGLLQTGHPALPRDVAADDVDRVPGD